MDRTALSRATDSSDAPTPGYLYNDLSRINAQNPTAARDTAIWIMNRLNSQKNPNVKFKCINLIQKLASAPGAGNFKRAFTMGGTEHVAAVKQYLQFRGPPDPLRGDEMYSRVRKVAQEALDAIYAEEQPIHSVGISTPGYGSHTGGMPAGALTGPPAATAAASYASPGYNGAATSTGGGGYGSSGSRMQGIGNPMNRSFSSPGSNSSISLNSLKQAASNLGEAMVGMVKDPLAKGAAGQNAYPSRGHSGPIRSSYGGPHTGGGGFSNPPGRSELAMQTGGQWTMASNRGLNAVSAPSGFSSPPTQPPPTSSPPPVPGQRQIGSVGGSWGQPQQQAGGAGFSVKITPTPASPNNPQAAQMVSTNGMPPVPSNAPAPDGSYERTLVEDLCPGSGMVSTPDPTKLKSFLSIVPTLQVDLVCPPLLDMLESKSYMQISKSLQVMSYLVKLEDEEIADEYRAFLLECRGELEPLVHYNKFAVRDSASSLLQDLGILDAVQSKNPNKSRPVAAAKVASAPVDDLLSFSPEKNAQVELPKEEAPKPAISNETSSSNGDLFGGLMVSDNPKKGEAPVTVDSASDLLSGLTMNEPVSSSSAAPSQKSAAVVNKDIQTPPVPSSSSGFGFINSKPDPSAPQPVTAPVSPKPTTAPTTVASSDATNELLSLGTASNTGQPSSPMPLGGINQMYQQAHMMRSVMNHHGNGNISLMMDDLDASKKKDEQNKKFDFVKDAMKSK